MEKPPSPLSMLPRQAADYERSNRAATCMSAIAEGFATSLRLMNDFQAR